MQYRLTVIFLFVTLLVTAQGFRARHSPAASLNNLTKAVYETTPGNYISGGLVYDSLNGHYSNRLCLMGLNSQGQVQWSKKYGSYQFEYLNNIFISRWFYKENNYLYYTGGARDINNKYVGVLIKFDLNGDTLWQKIYRDPTDYVIPQRVTKSIDGGFLITGIFEGTNYRACMIIKTDANGNELWRKKVRKNIPDVSEGKAIVQDPQTKKIAIVGYQYLGSASSFAGFNHLLILDSLGTVLVRYNFDSRQGAFSDLIQTNDGKLVAVGAISQNYQINGYNALKNYAVKFDINTPGVPIWVVETGIASSGTYFSCITELNNGDLMLGGGVDTLNAHNLPFNCLMRLTKINKDGVLLYNRFYDYKTNGINDDNSLDMHCLNPTSDGGFISAIECSNQAPNPFFIVKYDANGCDSTLAYCALINNVGIGSIAASSLLNIYPNPASSILNVNVNNSAQEILSLSFTDLYGHEIKRIKLEQDNNHVNVKDLATGIYLLQVRNGEQKVISQGKFVKEE